MNSRCLSPLFRIAFILLIVDGCIKSDTEKCGPQGVNVYFYSKTPCENNVSYPEDINNLLIAAFDKNNIMAAYTEVSNIDLNSDYFKQLELGYGLFTIIAWSGITTENFDISNLQTGVTTKSDLLFRIKRTQDLANLIEDIKIFYGESAAVYVEENKKSDPLFENISINMLEVTNRITISVEGLDDIDMYEIFIESNNGAMNINGTVATDEVIIHTGKNINEADTLKTYFTTLKLETGQTNTIVIRNSVSESEIFRGSLLGALLLKNPEVNLACDHDFVIEFTTEDQCDCGTYVITEIRVNNWLVHSYETEF